MNDPLLQRMFAPLMRRIQLMLGRAVLTGINDSLKAQNVQLTALAGETLDDVERLLQYGQISVPLSGAEAIIACIGAQRDQTVVLVAEDRRYRPTGLPAGDSGLYHYEGHRIRLTKNGRCIITCKALEVYADDHVLIDTPKTIFTGDVEVQKNLHVLGNFELDGTGSAKGDFTMSDAVIAGIRYSGHRHQETQSITGGPQ